MDFVFDAFMAWNALGLFLMAAVFILIGGGMVGYELFWMATGRSIKARVKHIDVVGVKDGQEKKEEIAPEISGKTDSGKPPLLFYIIFLGVPLIFSGFGGYMGYKYMVLTNSGEYVQARVVRNDESYDSESGTSYKAVLSFKDKRGKMWEVKDAISYGNSPSYEKGEMVDVYYDVDDPEYFVIGDFWHSMGLALVFMLIFPVFLLIAAFVARSTNAQEGRKKGKEISHKKDYSSEKYYPVYEYKLPNGEHREMRSAVGSSMIGGQLPGREVRLLMSKRNPDKIKKPHLFFVIFGMIFLAPGLFILQQAVQSFEFNMMMIVMPLAIIGFIALKIRRFIQKIPKEEWDAGWKDFRKDGMKFSVSQGKGTANARPLSMSELRTRMKAYAGQYLAGGYICVLIALGLSGGAYYAGQDMIEKTRDFVTASGEVVDFESTSSDGSYSYYSVVRFEDVRGEKVKFRDSIGSSHKMHKRGDRVDVLYNPDRPRDAMIDRGVWNWTLSLGLLLGAVLLLWNGLWNFSMARIGRGGSRAI